MRYFIGIVPSADIYKKVQDIQNKFGDNRLEPHITIKPPAAVGDVTAWLQAIETICKSFDPFSVALPSTGSFGSRVLFIDVDSHSLHLLHYAILKATDPYQLPYNKQPTGSYKPHLTLGRSWCGFTRQGFAEMKQLADEYLSMEPVKFEVNFLRIYHKHPNQGRYVILTDVQLG